MARNGFPDPRLELLVAQQLLRYAEARVTVVLGQEPRGQQLDPFHSCWPVCVVWATFHPTR